MKKKRLQRALINSIMSMILCCLMLFGTTYAWFSEMQESKAHTFQTGRLTANVEYYDGAEWRIVKDSDEIAETLLAGVWEPGVPKVMPLRISNVGTMDFTYELEISPLDSDGNTYNIGTDKINSDDEQDAENDFENNLFDVMYVGYLEGIPEVMTDEELIEEVNDTSEVESLSDGIRIVGELEAMTDEESFDTDDFEGDEITLVIYIPIMGLDEATARNEQTTKCKFGIRFVATQIVDEDILEVLQEQDDETETEEE